MQKKMPCRHSLPSPKLSADAGDSDRSLPIRSWADLCTTTAFRGSCTGRKLRRQGQDPVRARLRVGKEEDREANPEASKRHATQTLWQRGSDATSGSCKSCKRQLELERGWASSRRGSFDVSERSQGQGRSETAQSRARSERWWHGHGQIHGSDAAEASATGDPVQAREVPSRLHQQQPLAPLVDASWPRHHRSSQASDQRQLVGLLGGKDVPKCEAKRADRDEPGKSGEESKLLGSPLF